MPATSVFYASFTHALARSLARSATHSLFIRGPASKLAVANTRSTRIISLIIMPDPSIFISILFLSFHRFHRWNRSNVSLATYKLESSNLNIYIYLFSFPFGEGRFIRCANESSSLSSFFSKFKIFNSSRVWILTHRSQSFSVSISLFFELKFPALNFCYHFP